MTFVKSVRDHAHGSDRSVIMFWNVFKTSRITFYDYFKRTFNSVKVKFDSFRRKTKIGHSIRTSSERKKRGKGSNPLTPILAFKVTHLDDRLASGIPHPSPYSPFSRTTPEREKGLFASTERADKRSQVSFLFLRYTRNKGRAYFLAEGTIAVKRKLGPGPGYDDKELFNSSIT
ncbi:hypothetical protein NPIL_318691 [Nephila pilipes]|uniref:Uncharacterized protein n=1 Tax=Nephila pilipes TaxID=299642 RepID=A0A8X6NKH3_NEPPI|nr:hypothetical protein NPIL_318691 [Nephila pilipes]